MTQYAKTKIIHFEKYTGTKFAKKKKKLQEEKFQMIF